MIMKAAELISQALERKGIKSNYSTSHTDYGTSCYFTFYKDSESLEHLKIRVSDHSVTNSYRMAEEMHVSDMDVDVEKAESVAESVEFYLFPERFSFVPAASMEKGKKYHMIKGKLHQRVRN